MVIHLVRSELAQLWIYEKAHNTLNQVGWLDYFLHLQGFHNEVALEFNRNLSNGVTMVKGI